MVRSVAIILTPKMQDPKNCLSKEEISGGRLPLNFRCGPETEIESHQTRNNILQITCQEPVFGWEEVLTKRAHL
jgi:hypothetical protein